MFCKKCGNGINQNDTFCEKCGAQVGEKKSVSSSNKIKIDLSKANFLAIVSTILTLISIFCPFVTMTVLGSTMEKALIDGDGIFVLIICIVLLVLAILNLNIPIIICGVINLAIFIIENITLSNIRNDNEFSEVLIKTLVNRGSGFYLLLIGSIFIIASGFYGYMSKKGKNSFSIPNISKISNMKDDLIEKSKNIEIDKKIIKKACITFGIAVIIVIVVVLLIGSGNPGKFIKNNNKIQYKLKSGELVKNDWIKHNGNFYFFDKNGYKMINSWVDNDYYVGEDGKMKSDYFLDENGSTYYLKKDGKYAKNEIIDIKGKSYAFSNDGKNIKSSICNHASPSYIAYVNSNGYIQKSHGYFSDGENTVYINDENTGELFSSGWLKNENTGDWNFFGEDGLMKKDKIIAEWTMEGKKTYTVDTSDESLNILMVVNGLLSAGGVNEVISYYYVDETGAMISNTTKVVNEVLWVFDNDGKGEKQIWTNSEYTDTHEKYIKNEPKFPGFCIDGLTDKEKEAYLTVYIDYKNIAFFIYEGSSKELIKNSMTYSNRDYYCTLVSKTYINGYKFTGTMYTKGNRIFVDNSNAKTVIKNLLLTGEGFAITIVEDSDYWPDQYTYFIDAANYSKIVNN